MVEKPDLEDYSPTKAELFFKTRKRNPERKYKSETKLINLDEKESPLHFLMMLTSLTDRIGWLEGMLQLPNCEILLQKFM